MNILERYAEAFDKKDIGMMSTVFCEEGIFDDDAVKLLTGKPAYLEGRDTIISMFTELFKNEIKVNILKMAEDEKSMEYDVIVNGQVLPCIGILQEEKDGMMKLYRCEPRP